MTARPDIVVRCEAGHVMQRFRWMAGQDVWHPTRGQSEVVPVSRDGTRVGYAPFDDDPRKEWPPEDHVRWPMTCNECVPRQTRPVRDDRMSVVLTVLHAHGATDVKIGVVDEILRKHPAARRRE